VTTFPPRTFTRWGTSGVTDHDRRSCHDVYPADASTAYGCASIDLVAFTRLDSIHDPLAIQQSLHRLEPIP